MEVDIVRYASRSIDRDRFGVVDTETGVEEIMTHEDALVTLPYGEEVIKGVVHYGMGGNYCGVVPYQPNETLSRKQLKTKIMKQVEVRLYNGQITCVSWNPGELKHDVEIRLSDFGKSCAAFIMHAKLADINHIVTFVLDNKCKYGRFTFCEPSRGRYPHSCLNMTLKVDIRECSTFRALILHKRMSYVCNEVLIERLIDHEWRNKLYNYLGIVKTVACAPFYLTLNLSKLLFKGIAALWNRRPKSILEF